MVLKRWRLDGDGSNYPEKEQDRDQAERIYGLAQRELSSTCALVVAIPELVFLEEAHSDV
jgi:hypothetical protein